MSEYANYVEQAAYEDGLEKGRQESRKRTRELEAKLDLVRELPARGTQSVIMIGGYWINRADLMEALADD